MKFLEHLLERLPGVLGMKDGHGWSVGVTPTASLPACIAAREGEQRRQVGSGGTASSTRRCIWNGAAFAWTPDNTLDHLSDVGGMTAILTGTATWDPGLIADNADTATNLTVTGAAVGDAVTVGLSTLTTQDAILSAAVQATNDVRVMLSNRSGANLDLGSGTVRVWIFKA